MYSSDYGMNEVPNFDTFLNGATGVVVFVVLLLALICIAVGVLLIVANCKIYKKAGEEWWKALIPIYSSWVETKFVGLGWWWFPILCGLCAFTGKGDTFNYVIGWGLLLTTFNYNYNLAKKFGKTNGFAVLNTILPIIGLPILAFGNAQYDKNAKVDENGIFSIKK